MNALWHLPAIALAVTTALQSPQISLAEAARREALRRKSTPKAEKVLTNADLPTEPPPAAVTRPEPLPPAPGAQPAPAPPADAPPEAAAPPREEKWWRTRMDAAVNALQRNQLLAESVQSRINALQADVVNIDDPAQQGLKRQQLGQSLNELERLRAQVAADEKAIQDIRTEARKHNIPPGWIR